MVVLYGVGFQFAWGTIPWIYPAELFSMSEKGLLDDSGDFGLAGDVFMLEGEDSAQNWGICIGIPSPIFQTLRIAHPNHFNQPPKKTSRGARTIPGSAVSLAVGVNYVANALVVYVTPSFMSWSTVGTLRLGFRC